MAEERSALPSRLEDDLNLLVCCQCRAAENNMQATRAVGRSLTLKMEV
jgi:hypothetical protein